MKRIASLLLALCLIFNLAGCGSKDAPWKEQYDLGIRYLSEGNYQEAIVAFNAAIQIERKIPVIYQKLSEAYVGAGDTAAAADALIKGYEATKDRELAEKYEELTGQPMPNRTPELETGGDGQDKNQETNENKPKTFPPDLVVPVENPEAEEALREAAGKTEGDLTAGDLAKITKLNLHNKSLTDISFLIYCTGLKELDLSSWTPMEEWPANWDYRTPLEGWNQITDLSPLADLTSLERLDVRSNQLSDLSPLSGLTSLKVLELSDNNISDLSPLAELKLLTELYLFQNNIMDVGPLSQLTALTKLNLGSNVIEDVAPLSGLTNLVELDMDNNWVTDYSPLEKLPNYNNFYLN